MGGFDDRYRVRILLSEQCRVCRLGRDGPPNEHPELWMQQARLHFAFAVGLFAIGAAVIWFVRPRGPFGTAARH
jgi:hypothetical protein